MAKDVFQDIIHYLPSEVIPEGRIRVVVAGARYGIRNDPTVFESFLNTDVEEKGGFKCTVRRGVLEVCLPPGKKVEEYPDLLPQLVSEWKRLNGEGAEVELQAFVPDVELLIRHEEKRSFLFTSFKKNEATEIHAVRSEIPHLKEAIERFYGKGFSFSQEKGEWTLVCPPKCDQGIAAFIAAQVWHGLMEMGKILEGRFVHFRIKNEKTVRNNGQHLTDTNRVGLRPNPNPALMQRGKDEERVNITLYLWGSTEGKEWNVTPNPEGLLEVARYFAWPHRAPRLGVAPGGNWALIFSPGNPMIKKVYGFIAKTFTLELRRLGVFGEGQQVDLLVTGGIDLQDWEAEKMIAAGRQLSK